MTRRIYKLAAVLLVTGALVGGAYGVARHAGGDADYQSEDGVFKPALPALPGALVVVTPAAQPPPTVVPSLETAVVEESAAAPEGADAGSLVLAPDTPSPPPEMPPPVDPAILAAGLVAGINAERVAAGLPPLQDDPDLAMVARERSNDMVQEGYFGHVSPTGVTSVTLMDRYGIPHSWSGENIAYNNYPDSQTVAAVLSGWMSSPGHRNNILSPQFNKVGVGVVVDASGMRYYTAVFAES